MLVELSHILVVFSIGVEEYTCALAELREHVLPPSEHDLDILLLAPAELEHPGVHLRVGLDDGVLLGLVPLDRRVHEPHPESHVEHLAA
ncbi:Os03g0761250, partial [Oryza sativa Japonica Group]